MPGEKTEQPTHKRLQDARKKGQVCKSNDLTQACLFLAAAGVLFFGGGAFWSEAQSLMKSSLSGTHWSVSPDQLPSQFGEAMLRLFALSGPFLAAVFAVSAAVNFVQVRALFAPEILKPKFEKLNPLTGFQNIFFKPKTYLELIKNLVKFGLVIWLAYKFFSGSVRDITLTAQLPLVESSRLGGLLVFRFIFTVGALFLLIGAADYLIQRKLHMKELMMSRDEVVREYKESEGDPHVKSMRKQLHEQILNQSMIQNVPKANVIVVNPTHLAVAVEYEEVTMNAPRVTAKGQNTVAEKIREIGREHSVPILQNVGLARSLYEVEIGTEIPEDLYEAVAEVLNWVYQLAESNPQPAYRA
jgi:flagellar biosynthetic protein FlhB